MNNVGESRHDLLNWINQLLQMNMTKIEHLGTGAAYCQIMDSIYGDVPLHKVKFNANQEFQYVQNFKVLQGVFTKHSIDNAIPVEKLIKLKFQDNLEFIQWMKRFWESSGGPHVMDSYDPVTRRSGSAVAPPIPSMAAKNATLSSPRRTNTHGAIPDHNVATLSTKASSLVGGMASISLNNANGNGSINNSARTAIQSSSHSPRSSLSIPSGASAPASDRIKELNTVIAEMKATLESMEKERDFYFSKLRELEVLIQTHDESCSRDDLVKQIQAILYNDSGE